MISEDIESVVEIPVSLLLCGHGTAVHHMSNGSIFNSY